MMPRLRLKNRKGIETVKEVHSSAPMDDSIVLPGLTALLDFITSDE